MADVREKVDQIRQAIYGIEVRESIASGIEAINTEVESTTQRQTTLETDMAEAKREAEEATTRANTAAGDAEDITEAMAIWEEYDPDNDYAPLNKVAYQGSSYINVLACKGVPPTEETHWLPIASKGDKGEPGPVPTIIVGDTTTLSPGSAASVTRRADSPDDAPVLDFGIPRGVDGTGSGDMAKAIYDDNDDGKVNAADVADAVPTGAITDDMLSNDPNHIKARLSSHMADNVSQNPHGITAIANKNYDRGTWTPIIADGAGFTTDYVTQYGRFQRIDDVFYINGYIKASVTHTGQTSLTLRVSGLPAVPRDGSFDALSGFVSRFTAEGYTQVVAKHDGTRFLLDIEFYLIGSGKTVKDLAIGELPSGEVIEIYLEGSFRV